MYSSQIYVTEWIKTSLRFDVMYFAMNVNNGMHLLRNIFLLRKNIQEN